MGTTSQKLTYLNETKTLLKNKINLTGANITDDTFRQYPTKLQNALLNCWNNEGEPIFTNWSNKINGEGTNVKLDNTLNARMKITPKGNTSQNGTPTPSSPIPVNVVSGDNEVVVCGKNIQANEWQVGRYDGSATTTNIHLKITNASLFEENQSYVIQFKSTNSNYKSKSIYLQSTNGEAFFGSIGYDSTNQIYYCTKTMSSTEINLFSGSQVRLAVFVSGGVSSGDITEGMITKGNTIKTTYEPYTSQNYPLYLGVENLFDGEIELGSINAATGELISNNSRTRSKNYTKVKPNTTYYFKGTITSGNRWIIGYKADKTAITDGTFSSPNPATVYSIYGGTAGDKFTTTATTEYIKWYDTNSTDLTELVEITKGSTPQYISTTPIELNKIGTYQDYFYKDNSKWYLHKEVGKVVLNGSESGWAGENFGSYRRYNLPINDIKDITDNADFVAYSDYFYKDINALNSANCLPGMMCQFRNTKKVYFVSSESSIMAWLPTHNTTLYYPLATSEEVPITNTTLINQLEALKGAMSYEGQTNISSGFMIVSASALGELE